MTAAALVCDYCGETGHTWHVHPQAHVDVATWQAHLDAEANR
jgi:hypothetical protein